MIHMLNLLPLLDDPASTIADKLRDAPSFPPSILFQLLLAVFYLLLLGCHYSQSNSV